MTKNSVVPAKSNFLDTNFDAFDTIADEASEGQSFGIFLNMSGNDGSWEYGQDKEVLDTPTRAILNPSSWEKGIIVWVDGEVVANYMTPVLAGKPMTLGQVPDHGPYSGDDGPKDKQTITMKLIDGSGIELLFQANNKSKIRAVENLMTEFKKTYKEHHKMLPVVEIDSVSFEAKDKENPKKKFKKYAPVFKIVDWYDAEQVADAMSGNRAEYNADDGADEVDTTPEQATSKSAAAGKPPATAGRRGRFA
jgi:hypothetical protein